MTRMLPKTLLLLAVAGLLAGCPSYGPNSLLNSTSLDRAVAVRSLRARTAEREAFAGTGSWGTSKSSSRLVGPPIYSGQTYYGALGIVSAPGGYGSYSSGSSYRSPAGCSYSSGNYSYGGGHAVGGAGASYGRYFPTYNTGIYYYGTGTIGGWPVYPPSGHRHPRRRPEHPGYPGRPGCPRHPWHNGPRRPVESQGNGG